MGRLFKIRLDWAALRSNLSREHGHQVSDQEITGWLTEAGFNPSGEEWLVREENLGHVQPEEVTEAEIIGPDESGSTELPGDAAPA
jgi:hypothetical protein